MSTCKSHAALLEYICYSMSCSCSPNAFTDRLHFCGVLSSSTKADTHRLLAPLL